MKHLILLTLSCLFCLSTIAQPALVMQNNVTYLNMMNGLPSNFVDDLYTDSYGFMWIATHSGGLVRYDGYAYRYFGTGKSDMTTHSNTCHNITEDRFHRLWVCFDEYTEVIDLKTMKTIVPKSTNDKLRHLLRQLSVKVYCDYKGAIWLVGRSMITHLSFDQMGNVHQIRQIAYQGNTPDVTIADINHDGSLWAAIDGGICRLVVSGNKLVKCSLGAPLSKLHNTFITSLLRHQNHIWIGTWQGLLRYDVSSNTLQTYRHSNAIHTLSHDYVSSLALSPNNQLIVGTLGGVNFYQPKSDDFSMWTTDSKHHPLSSNFVNCIAVDHGSIWIGTETGGIIKLNPRPLQLENFAHSTEPTSLSANAVNAMYAEADGTLWVGTVEGGLNRKAKEAKTFTHFTTANSSLSHNAVSTLAADDHQNLWIGTWGGGLNLINLRTHATIQRLKLPEVYARLTQFIGALCMDQRNQLMWIGTNDGVFAFDLQRHQLFEPFKNCRNIRGAIGATIDKEGFLWMGCGTGVVKIDLKSNHKNPRIFRCQHMTYKLDAPKSGIIDKLCAFCQGRDGTLWLGSNGYGLYKRIVDKHGNQHFKAYTQRDGLAHNAVRGIVEDAQGMLWITTENGLSHFNPHRETFTNYTTNDGLLSSQFYWNSAIKATNGTLYFGSDKGLTALLYHQPTRLFCGRLRFTRLLVNNEEVGADSQYLCEDIHQAKEIHISEADKSITFEFSSLNFSNEEQCVYSCRMKGFEHDWIQLKPGEHSMRYTNLPPGDYEFQVRCVSATDDNNNLTATVHVVVSPRFWKTWWFCLLSLIALLLMGRYLYQQRVKVVRRREAERLMKPIEEALNESEAPSELQQRIEGILHVQKKMTQSKQRCYLTDQTEMQAKQQPFMDRVMAIVETHYNDSAFGVMELADQLGMNRNLVSRNIHAETGCSTSQFLRNYRLDIAKKILMGNPHDRNITEIAYKVGFNDPKYFTRCYTKRFGEAPKKSLSNDANAKQEE